MNIHLKLLIILGFTFILEHSNMKSSQVDISIRVVEDDEDVGKTGSMTFARSRKANQYRGCYRDDGTRNLKHYHVFGASNRVMHCINYCRVLGYVYAGLQFSTWCFCGNTFPKPPQYPKLSDDMCNMACAGDPGKMCGGTWANSIYNTGNEIFFVKPDGTKVNMEDDKMWKN